MGQTVVWFYRFPNQSQNKTLNALNCIEFLVGLQYRKIAPNNSLACCSTPLNLNTL